MYLKKVIIENYGPYENLDIDFHFDSLDNPIPLVLIGKNGSGKTILLSHIVNSLISAKQMAYEDSDMEQGKAYKYRSSSYIHTGKNYSFSKVEYTDGSFVIEWQLRKNRQELESDPNFIQPRPEWQNIPKTENSFFQSTFTEPIADEFVGNNCILYFPANRFEDPAWLNKENLTQKAEYQDLKKIRGYSNRSIVTINSLKNCQRWLLDILLDRNTLELIKSDMPIYTNTGQSIRLPVFHGFQGPASHIYEEIIKLLNQLFNEPAGTLRFGLGNRKNRQLSIMKSNQTWITNLFQLSSGESLLLGLFLTIIKDYDLSDSAFQQLSEITGIVIIDEIDSHLHGKLQKEILPSLLKLFPKIQFILTTHSPMFLMGMENTFGTNSYDILELPSAEVISIERFSEFIDLFTAISESKTHAQLVESKIKESQLPIVFVEGDYDIKYLTKTIEYFFDDGLISRFRFADGEGFGNLDKIWTSMNSKVAKVLTTKTLLLYDCDIAKINSNNEKIYKRTIPIIESNPVSIGIENLLSHATIAKLEMANPCYIDIIPERTERIRGENKVIAEVKKVNKDEKKNICNWLIQNGDKTDFEGFKNAVLLIIEFLDS